MQFCSVFKTRNTLLTINYKHMKTMKLKALVLILLCIGACGPIQDQTGIKDKRNCGTMLNYNERLDNEPEFKRNERDLENRIGNYIENLKQGGLSNLRSQVVTIPVVVHVVYNTSAQNISNAQIQSQIANLNRDFRRNNADASTIPSAFSGLAADTRIEFKNAGLALEQELRDGERGRRGTRAKFSKRDR